MPVSPGTHFGPYEILAPIGAGGMGEVYKARDPRLDRVVAIKVAKEKFSERFEREARAVAALNHPHICQIYDVGPDYLVMEYIEGTVLKGPLPLAVALRYGAEICDALDAAHKKGITHRDLKPGNILVTKAGVKLLDFGLAKTKPAFASDDGGTTTMALTGKGEVLGTLQYMSPEQLQGQEVGPPSDLFSFGLVLYEMLTGKRAFEASSPASVIAAILDREAPSVAGVAPMAANRLLRRCLAKDPEQRWQNAHDVKLQLESLPGEPEDAPPVPVSERRILPWILAALCAGGMLAVSYIHFRGARQETRLINLSVLPPEKAAFRSRSSAAVSPDGRSVAFVARLNGKYSLWVRELDARAARQLGDTDAAAYPFWSPDSQSIGFFADRKLKRIGIAGGSALSLCDVAQGVGGSWSKKGVIVFAPTYFSGLFRVSASGGSPIPVTELDQTIAQSAHGYPWFLPDGHRFLYAAFGKNSARNGVYLGDVDSKAKSTNSLILAVSSNAIFASPGYLLYLRERTLMAQPFDADQARTTGDPIPIAEHVNSNFGQGQFSSSQNGVLAYLAGGGNDEDVQLTWFDRSGKVEGVVGTPGLMSWPGISPDGTNIVVDRLDPQSGNYGLWMYNLSGTTTASRFSFDLQSQSPVWSPDGRHIAFISNREGRNSIYRKSTSGAGQEEILDSPPELAVPEDWSRDGRYIVEVRSAGNRNFDLWALPVPSGKAEGSKPFPYLQSDANEHFAKLSRDGRWLAYTSDETRRDEVYVQSFPTPGGKRQISTDGGSRPIWSKDGKELFFIRADGKLMAAALKSGSEFDIGPPKALFDTHLPLAGSSWFDVGRNGRFLIPTPVEQGSVPMTVVVNWTAGMKR